MGMGGEIFKNLQLGAWAPTIQCQSICRVQNKASPKDFRLVEHKLMWGPYLYKLLYQSATINNESTFVLPVSTFKDALLRNPQNHWSKVYLTKVPAQTSCNNGTHSI